MHIFCQKWPISIIIFVWVAKILKNCSKIVYIRKKYCKKEIFYFPHPFSGKQHQSLFTSEILPFNWFFGKIRKYNKMLLSKLNNNLCWRTTVSHRSYKKHQFLFWLSFSLFEKPCLLESNLPKFVWFSNFCY